MKACVCFFWVKCSVIVNTIKIRQLHHKTNFQCYLVDSAFTVVFRWFEIVFRQLVASWIPILHLIINTPDGSLESRHPSENTQQEEDFRWVMWAPDRMLAVPHLTE
jgi:hypothetical protein